MNENILWKRQVQERENDYVFNGKLYVTSIISEELSTEELASIINDIRKVVKENVGIDYLQVYKHPDGRKIFCIDQLSRSMLDGDGYSKKEKKNYNYWTMLYSYEY